MDLASLAVFDPHNINRNIKRCEVNTKIKDADGFLFVFPYSLNFIHFRIDYNFVWLEVIFSHKSVEISQSKYALNFIEEMGNKF